ncbi:MAG: glycosyltransferase [Alloprevotella sp.]|nr:glycosyltransferase [Alloprevotella sp.]
MLSILIPTYQSDCSALVFALDRQARALKEEKGEEFDYEIIVSDDASDSIYIYSMQERLSGLANFTLLLHDKNLGRAANRNALINAARFPWVLLIDSDARADRENFIAKYWKERAVSSVVYGGIETATRPPSDEGNYTLRLKYELAAQKRRSLHWRRQHPYENFSTFNFFAHKSVFAHNLFDTRCRNYGYEDTLFGFTLQEKKIPIKHIDNPLTHVGIDRNEEFLQKIRLSLHTLCALNDPRLDAVGAVRAWRTLHTLRLDRIIARLKGADRLLEKNLLSTHPRLWILKLYKALYFCRLKAQSTSDVPTSA